MRTFFRAHWKVLVAILLLIVLATLTLSPTAAMPAPSLSARLRAHAAAIAAQDRTQTHIFIVGTPYDPAAGDDSGGAGLRDTAFMRSPYFHTADEVPDQFDDEGVARVLGGLARTIRALAAGTRA